MQNDAKKYFLKKFLDANEGSKEVCGVDGCGRAALTAGVVPGVPPHHHVRHDRLEQREAHPN